MIKLKSVATPQLQTTFKSGNRPFVGDSTGDIELNVQRVITSNHLDDLLSEHYYVTTTYGVECTESASEEHTQNKKSPHLNSTHMESDSHVYGNTTGLGTPILEAFEQSHFKQPVTIHKLTLTPKATEHTSPMAQVGTFKGTGDTKYATYKYQIEEDHYYVHHKISEKPPSLEPTQKFVTKAQLIKALKGIKLPEKGPLTIAVDLAGEDPQHWSVFTVEAILYLKEQNIHFINSAPSTDIPSEGGLCINHKLYFGENRYDAEDPPNSRIIIETAPVKELENGATYQVIIISTENEAQDTRAIAFEKV